MKFLVIPLLATITLAECMQDTSVFQSHFLRKLATLRASDRGALQEAKSRTKRFFGSLSSFHRRTPYDALPAIVYQPPPNYLDNAPFSTHYGISERLHEMMQPIQPQARPTCTTSESGDWRPYGGCRYHACSTSMTADEAAANCTDAGATLATKYIKNEEDRKKLFNIFGFNSDDGVWLGVTDQNGYEYGHASYANGDAYHPYYYDMYWNENRKSCGFYRIRFNSVEVEFTNCNEETHYTICEICP